MFSDPSTSPAYFAKSLHVGCVHAVTAVDAGAGGQLRGLVYTVHMGVGTQETYVRGSIVSLVPFQCLGRTPALGWTTFKFTRSNEGSVNY